MTILFVFIGSISLGYVLGQLFPLKERVKVVERVELVPRQSFGPPRPPAQ